MWNIGKWRDQWLASSMREAWRRRMGWKAWRWIEVALLSSGLGVLAVVGVSRLDSALASRAALKSFETMDSSNSSSIRNAEQVSGEPANDLASGNENLGRAHKEDVSERSGVPITVLQIPKIHLAVPLLDGTDASTLNHAVGRIRGTARPGEKGNIGIAGHRDSFFRGLKDLKLGDEIELRRGKATDTYIIDEIQIVTPDNVGVLRARKLPSLTLVTCYPFYYIGSAPKRYVVMASLAEK
jgi:sortase A